MSLRLSDYAQETYQPADRWFDTNTYELKSNDGTSHTRIRDRRPITYTCKISTTPNLSSKLPTVQIRIEMHILSKLSQTLGLLLNTSFLKKFLQDCTILDKYQRFPFLNTYYLDGYSSSQLWLSPAVLRMPGGL